MKKLFFAVILFTMAIVCLGVGASCKKKNAGTSALSDYEDSVETIESNETKTSESAKSSDTADTTESVKASEETSFSENISSEKSTGKSEGGKTSETTETTETSDTTEIPESSDSSEESKPSESTESPKPSESTATSEESSESVSESKPESSSESNSESISESSSESVSDSVESSSSEGTDGETVSESQSESTSETQTDTEPETKDSCGDSSESGEGETDYDELSDSGDSSEGGKAVEDAKTVLDIVSGAVEELAIKVDEAEFTAEFFSILKDKGYTHFKFKAESDGVDDYVLSGNKYPSDNGVAEIRVEAYRFFDKSVSLKSSEATYIRIYDFVFFSSEETENLTFGDNGYLCYEDEGLVYADYGSGEEYGFKFPDKYFEFERSIENGNAVVTYKTSDGNSCDFKWLIRSEVDNSLKLSDPIDGIVSNTSIYINNEKLSKDFIAIRPNKRTSIVFNKCELVYAGGLKVGRCRPDKKNDREFKVECKGDKNQSEFFHLKVNNAREVKITIETKSEKIIVIYSDDETSCDVKETNGKYETMVTLSYTGDIKILIDDCETFSLRYEIIS